MSAEKIFFHEDALSRLNDDASLADKLAEVHRFVRGHMPFVARIAVALYDAATDMLKTFVHSTDGENPLSFYEAKLGDSESLREIVRRRRPRVVNDIDLYGSDATHARNIRGGGYGSSY
ncbi:MAG: phosphohydrolase, partial [Rhodocyclales bacterium]|nr:phosphohydrolase [Rhodocyclales bacterium]